MLLVITPMRKGSWFLAILIVFVLVLIFFEPILGGRIARFVLSNESSEQYSDLILENQALRAEVARLEAVGVPMVPADFVEAAVFTKYPFNFKSEFLVETGRDKGLKEGQSVVVMGGGGMVLIGKTSEVFDKTAVVKTIFDKSWQSSIRIGKKGFLALLQGGGEPKATLIPKDAVVDVGDVVYSVDPSLPHSIAIGEVESLGQTPDKVFQEARIKFAYNLESVLRVGILK